VTEKTELTIRVAKAKDGIVVLHLSDFVQLKAKENDSVNLKSTINADLEIPAKIISDIKVDECGNEVHTVEEGEVGVDKTVWNKLQLVPDLEVMISNASGQFKYKVKQEVVRSPYVVILHPNDMKKFNLQKDDNVSLETVPEISSLRISACVTTRDSYGMDSLKEGEIAVTKRDQRSPKPLRLEQHYPDVLLLRVSETHVPVHKYTDYAIIVTEKNMKCLHLKEGHYVTLLNPCVGSRDGKPLQILARMMTLEKLNNISELKLNSEQIAADQTCRDALFIRPGDMIIISNPHIGPVWNERSLTWLDYQKAVVRVHENREFMEHKTPVACLSEDIMSSIGVNYGDRLEVEYMKPAGAITVKCAELTQRMKELHNGSLEKSKLAKFSIIKLESSSGAKQQSALNWSFEYNTRKPSPIFIDEITRKKLGVDVLDPVKIRKKFSWQFVKTMVRFGSVSLVAFSVTLGLLGTIATASDSKWGQLSGWFWADVVVTCILAGWAALGVVFSSTFRSN
jgi:formylmethanofuran dehydrogenase subunit D